MGSVIDEYVDPAQFGQGGLNNGAAVVRLLYIASDKHGLSARVLHKSLGLPSIIVLIQIGNEHVGALTRISDGDRAADSAVGACDDRLLAGQTARAAVGLFSMVGHWLHRVRFTGHWLLLLWKRRL